MELEILKTYIYNYLVSKYDKVEIGSRQINRDDFLLGFIVHIGDFKSAESFDIEDYTEYYENGTIDERLKKASDFIEYKFTSAGYSHEDGGRAKYMSKMPKKK